MPSLLGLEQKQGIVVNDTTPESDRPEFKSYACHFPASHLHFLILSFLHPNGDKHAHLLRFCMWTGGIRHAIKLSKRPKFTAFLLGAQYVRPIFALSLSLFTLPFVFGMFAVIKRVWDLSSILSLNTVEGLRKLVMLLSWGQEHSQKDFKRLAVVKFWTSEMH